MHDPQTSMETKTVTTYKRSLAAKTAGVLAVTAVASLLAGTLAGRDSVFAPPEVLAQSVCGDVNGSDDVTTSDALLVLKEAVGLDPNLVCEGQCSALEDRLAALETLLAKVTIKGNN